jgi:predicted transposase/invertase (TIGR01784 family)
MSLADAIGAGVKYALENGLMPDFIRKHSSEVNNMLFAEYDPVEARKVAMEEGFEDGYEDGLEKGLADGLEKGLADGHAKGLAEGLAEAARRMKRNGRSIEEIIADTGMSAEQIESI